MTRIEPSEERIELNKRQPVPFIVIATCSKCDQSNKVDLSDGYCLGYPTLGQPAKVYHHCAKCGHEWQTSVIVRLTLELAP